MSGSQSSLLKAKIFLRKREKKALRKLMLHFQGINLGNGQIKLQFKGGNKNEVGVRAVGFSQF